MSARPALAALMLAALAGCAHPEDRRWASASEALASALPEEDRPTVQVYSFPTAKTSVAVPTIRDFSDRGQAAIVAALTAKGASSDALRKALAAPLVDPGAGNPEDRTNLARTLVVSISKGRHSLPGERLVRTIVTITPSRDPTTIPFTFAGYSVAATDTKVQAIAHLEDVTDLSLTGSLAPPGGGLGTGSIGGTASRKRTTSADISQQYENLNVDIAPDKLVLTRESERGLDVVGNTLVSLTLAPAPGADPRLDYRVTSQILFDGATPLPAARATFVIASLATYERRALAGDVTLTYLLRHILRGREYYTEGKQDVQLVSGGFPAAASDRLVADPLQQVLVRPEEAQPPLYVVCAQRSGGGTLMAITVRGARQIVYYDRDAASEMAAWLSRKPASVVGKGGVTLALGKHEALPRGMTYRAKPERIGCAG